MGVEVLVAAVAATTAVGGIMAGQSAKGVAQQQKDTASDFAAIQTKKQEEAESARLAAYTKEAEISQEQQEKIEAAKDRDLRIQSQQFHIQTLSDILKGRAGEQPSYMVYRTPPAKEEVSIIEKINSYIGGLF